MASMILRLQFGLRTLLWLMVAIGLTTLTLQKSYRGGAPWWALTALGTFSLFLWLVYLPGFLPKGWWK
ncbi:MAG TPA: hypothetical protein VHC22_00655 [Pirellulales bacterium]|nr:hypothetical protein [Pirellulales bacterium]